ncbi:5948_t:CDS:2 [Gigaspora margarita]|uniref:5948_t:CDS:1 n=1 Tax=Gigaspora margarita TaxID=4874 RepID=A0ABN7X216_GIGMA|nr:5948_t:CDS:2 [Gigaspora margarita]
MAKKSKNNYVKSKKVLKNLKQTLQMIATEISIGKLKHLECPICKECFPSITLVVEEYCCCYNEKTLLKKFSFNNNMDLEKVPEELQELTKIEEMLIAQVFSVMVVYRLHGGQHRDRENIIKFS